MSKSVERKYQQLAQELEDAIRLGRLTIGSRLQSVRKVMEQRGLSLATVLSAYRRLEERGLIAARPKAGYFVVANGGPRTGAKGRVDESKSEIPGIDAGAECSNFPDIDLLPTQRLHRLTASMVRRHQQLSTRRPDALGLSKLRREIAQRSADVGSFTRPADVLITNGATEGLALAIRAVTRPGDSVALQAPANPQFLALLSSLHVRVVELQAEPHHAVSPSTLEAALATHRDLRACVLIPNFHHPTGALMSVAVKRALVDFASARNLAMIEIDVYGELQHQGPRPPPLKAFDTGGTVIYLTCYSNTIAPGLNVGWMAGGRWHAQIEISKQSIAVMTAELPQWVLYEFLNRGSHIPHYRRLRQHLRERTLRIDAALRGSVMDICRWAVPDGGHFLWLELPENVDATRLLAEPGLKQPGLLAGRSFSSSENSFGHCVRINTSLADLGSVAVLAKAIKRL